MVRAMNVRPLRWLLFTMAVAGLSACSGNKEASGSAAASGAAAPGASGAAASGAAASGGSKGAGGKTVHVTRTMGECIFDFDAPEEMKEKTKDGMSVTLTSPSFEFVGFDGTTLHSKPEHALDSFKSDYKEVYRGTENGVQVAILASVKNDKPATDNHVVAGMGGEPYSSERSLGCTFLCSGVKDREADVIAMCKSIRIKVTPEKKP
jgi:hypothetical protein